MREVLLESAKAGVNPKVNPNPNVKAVTVALHVRSRTNSQDKGVAIVDIFRLKNGKIVEHWDVIQEIPNETANNNYVLSRKYRI